MKAKRFRTIIWLTLALGLGLAVGCVKEDPSLYRRTIPGLWVAPDGLYYSFRQGSSVYVQGLGTAQDGGQIWKEGRLSYQVNCCSMQLSGTWPGIQPYPEGAWLDRQVEFSEMTDTSMTFRNLVYQLEGMDVVEEPLSTWYRVQENGWSDSLSGVWESVLIRGKEDGQIRLDFRSSAQYDYYTYQQVEEGISEWVLDEQNAGSWYNLNNELILNTFNNEKMGEAGLSSVLRAQIRKVEPKNGEMEWETGDGIWRFKYIAKP